MFILVIVYLTLYTDRTEFYNLLLGFVSLTILAILIGSEQHQKASRILLLGLIARIVVLVGFPTLSDDIYRFIWDGKLLHSGINPFLFTPKELITSGIATHVHGLISLYPNLNSKEFYSIYPPLVQTINLIGVIVGGENINLVAFVIKSFIFMADIGSMFLIYKLINGTSSNSNIYLTFYALNPLVIFEISGNAHHEGIYLFFILLGITLFRNKKYLFAGSSVGLAVATKILPLIFLPVFIAAAPNNYTRFNFATGFSTAAIIFLLPLVNNEILNAILSSGELYYNYFAFNSPVYQLTEFISQFYSKPWELTSFTGYFSLLSVPGILVISYYVLNRRLSIASGLFWSLFIYLALSRMIHPWYLVPLAGLGIISGNLTGTVWLLLSFVTYSTYFATPYHENKLWLITEYTLLILFIIVKYAFSSDQRIASLRKFINGKAVL